MTPAPTSMIARHTMRRQNPMDLLSLSTNFFTSANSSRDDSELELSQSSSTEKLALRKEGACFIFISVDASFCLSGLFALRFCENCLLRGEGWTHNQTTDAQDSANPEKFCEQSVAGGSLRSEFSVGSLLLAISDPKWLA